MLSFATILSLLAGGFKVKCAFCGDKLKFTADMTIGHAAEQCRGWTCANDTHRCPACKDREKKN